jgi:hypothetical protein
MAGSATAFTAGLLLAGGLAAAGWFLRAAPERDALEARLRDAEDRARRAGREAGDARQWAETEQEKRRFFEERVKELERVATSARPVAAAEPSGGHGAMQPAGVPPEEWDRTRLNQEIENLAAQPSVLAKHPRLPLVLRALRAKGDEGRDLVLQMLRAEISPGFTGAAAIFAEGLGETRAVPIVLERWATETDASVRPLLLRALANLPGEEALPVFREAWSKEGADAQTRGLAMQGLALRGDPVARAVAEGSAQAPPAQRVRAIEWLRAYAQRTGWRDATLVPVFGRALRTADGPAQRKLALIALEGLWSKDALADLDAFAADAASPPELAARARTLADALRGGAPRPENAGVPERSLVPDDGGAPADPSSQGR